MTEYTKDYSILFTLFLAISAYLVLKWGETIGRLLFKNRGKDNEKGE